MVIWLTRSSSTPAGGDISAEPFWVSESTCDLAQVKRFTDIYFQWIYNKQTNNKRVVVGFVIPRGSGSTMIEMPMQNQNMDIILK